MMMANAYLNSEQYELCEQVCTYMSKTFPNDNTVQIVSESAFGIIGCLTRSLDDGELFITKE